jgi:thiol-disulfide isomerase/thioredoxin
MIQYFKLILISALVTVLAILTGSLGWNMQILINGFIFLISGIIVSRWKGTFWINSVIILLPFTCIYTYVIIISANFHVIPIVIIQFPTYFIGSFIRTSFIRNLRLSIILSLTSIAFIILSGVFLMPNFLDYYFNKDKIVIEKSLSTFPILDVYDSEGTQIDFDKYESQILVIDVWSTSCGWCFKYFPYYQEIIDEYSKYDDISFISLNSIQRNDDFKEVVALADSLPYTFEHWFTKHESVRNEMNKLSIKSYPYFIVCNKKREIVYFGNANPKDRLLNRSIRKSLNSLI